MSWKTCGTLRIIQINGGALENSGVDVLLNSTYITLKVASTGIEPVSGASETLILSIVRRGHVYRKPKFTIILFY